MRGDPRRATSGARATASGSTRTACSPRGEPGVQLTWMDAKVGDWVVTPRIGKPVEIQALWLNALRIAECVHRGVPPTLRAWAAAFAARFWNEAVGIPLRRGRCRPRARARSIRRFAQPDPRGRRAALSSCSTAPRPAGRGRRRARLWTPLGLRTLAPARPAISCRATRATCRPATAPTTRAPSGPGCSVRSSRPGCECGADTADARHEARRRFLEPAPRAPGRGGPRAHLGDRRRRAAAHAARLSLPGVVGRRGAAARSQVSRSVAMRPGARVSEPPCRSPPSVARPGARHWPEYAMEAALLGIFMISACLLRGALTTRPRRLAWRFPTPTLRRLLIGLAMGATAIAAHLLGLGQAVGRALQPGGHADVLPAGQGARRGTRSAISAPSSRARWSACWSPGRCSASRLADPATHFATTAPGPTGVAVAFRRRSRHLVRAHVGHPAGLESREAWPATPASAPACWWRSSSPSRRRSPA